MRPATHSYQAWTGSQQSWHSRACRRSAKPHPTPMTSAPLFRDMCCFVNKIPDEVESELDLIREIDQSTLLGPAGISLPCTILQELG